ncbi:hypothetical protein MHBO_000905 [Bonamia ostreae]|uniref:NodB homology domain-containing protein n=1 Tax=Bonamia ostreae TaxID=126728 RepID=A0ABV2AIF3_9EUKA
MDWYFIVAVIVSILIILSILIFFLVIFYGLKIYSFFLPNSVVCNFDLTLNEKIGNPHHKKFVSLTIDDSPSIYTEHILQILNEHKAKATFFLIGSFIENREETVKKILLNGHEIANHMFKDRSSLKLKFEEFVDKMNLTQSIIDRLKDNDEKMEKKWIRPGGGFFNKSMLQYFGKNKTLTPVLGDIYPFDAQIKSKFIIKNTILKRAHNGGVIILHERKWTTSYLDEILTCLNKNNFECTTLSKMYKISKNV